MPTSFSLCYFQNVSLEAKTRRRWFGALCLLVAIAMLVVETTALKGRIVGFVALGYWLVCFLFTVIAIGVALLDLRAVQTETRAEHRALFESTLQKIKEEAPKSKPAGEKESPDSKS